MSLIDLSDPNYRSEYFGLVVRRVLIKEHVFIIEFTGDTFIVVEPSIENPYHLTISEGDLE